MKKLLLATTLLAATAGFAQAEPVRLATEGAYPPFNIIDDKGEVGGYERELGDEACKRTALKPAQKTEEKRLTLPRWEGSQWRHVDINCKGTRHDRV